MRHFGEEHRCSGWVFVKKAVKRGSGDAQFTRGGLFIPVRLGKRLFDGFDGKFPFPPFPFRPVG